MPTDVHLSSADPADPKTLGGAADYETTLPLSEDEGAAELSDHIGRFEIHERLGAGGMGVVYRAHDPRLDRPVALKLLLVEGDDTERARLQREAQALACLSHPNVVQVYESGVHHGRSYVVMELVVGQTLDRWLKAETRSLDEILEVFTQAGQGLAAAHEAGLVHRDFKPGNVMVGDDGRVRVFDFGLAQGLPFLARDDPDLDESGAMDAFSTEQRAELWTLTLTLAGKMLGTPAFMSPEQYDRRPTTAASDQFSFCVALFSALLDEHPFIDDPQEWYKLPLLVGDVDIRVVPKWRTLPRRIRDALQRGLAIDPLKRWPSMPALIDALHNDRRRWWIGGTGMLAAVAAGAYLLVPSSPPGCRSPEDGLRGTWDEARREQVKQALLATDVAYAAQTWIRVRDRLDDHAARWVSTVEQTCQATVAGLHSEQQLDLDMRCLQRDRQLLRAQVDVLAHADERVVRNAVRALDVLEPADRCLQHESTDPAPSGPEDPELVRQLGHLRERLDYVVVCERMGRFEEGLERVAELLPETRALGDGALEARTLMSMGELQIDLGRFADANTQLEAAYFLATKEDVVPVARRSAVLLTYLNGVWLRNFDDSHTWANHTVSLLKRDDDELARAKYFNVLGGVYEVEDKDDKAREFHEKALAIRKQVLGPNHYDVAVSQSNLAIVLNKQARHALAMEYIERAHSIWETVLGTEHPQTVRALLIISDILEDRGDHAESERTARTALELFERSVGAAHPYTIEAHEALANALLSQGRRQEAKTSYERALALWESALGPGHLQTSNALLGLARVELLQGRAQIAANYARRALNARERDEASDRDLAEARWVLAQALWERPQDQAQAIEMAERALNDYESLGEPGQSKSEDIRQWLRHHDAR